MFLAVPSFLGLPALLYTQLAVALFMAILFTQSGLDKVFNYQGNLAYFTDHFKKSPLAGTVGLLMPVITALEVGAGLCSAAGVVMLLFYQHTQVAWVGQLLAAAALLSLFLGQRVGKDYGGAAALVPYFLTALAGLVLLM
jgi:hypothetical protein